MLALYNSYGQNNIEISLQQDAILFLVGDQEGNDPLTVRFLSKIEVPVYSLEKSHVSTYLSLEYADLIENNYKRYALGAGYIVKSIYRKIGAAAYVDFGKIYRQKEGFSSFSLSGELNYKINERLKFIATQQLIHRKDLKALYNSTNEYMLTGFIGLKYSL
ncbi:MAG: hypothetical protein ACI8WA_001622 [Polaribacter sp.]|jgi:hypothetical protein